MDAIHYPPCPRCNEAFHVTAVDAHSVTVKRGPAALGTSDIKIVPVIRTLKPWQQRFERLLAPLTGDKCIFKGTYVPAPTVKASDIFKEP